MLERLRRRILEVWLLALALFVGPVQVAPPASAQPAATASPAAQFYLGRQIADTMHYSGAGWLMRDSRQREENCQRLVKELHVQPGQTICDLGCGNGFHTLKLAQLTGPRGKVYAVDIQPPMLEMLKARARAAKLRNIVPVLGGESNPHLPEQAVDLVLLVDAYHELSRPQEMLRQLRKSLSPTGRIAVVEFRAEDPQVPIKPLHKMSKAQIVKEFSANGLKLAGQFDGLPWQHLLFFARDENWSK